MIDDEKRAAIDAKLRRMSVSERVELIGKLYMAEYVPMEEARKLLGIDEDAYSQQEYGYYMYSLEWRFDNLSTAFLARKLEEERKENGEY